MMKKIVLSVLVVCLIFMLASCGAPEENFPSLPPAEELPREEEKPVSETALFFGRVRHQNGISFLDWSGSCFTLRFVGTDLSVVMGSAENIPQFTPYVRITVDGRVGPPRALGVVGPVPAASGLPYGVHQVTVTKITEPLNNRGISVLKALVSSGDETRGAAFLPVPEPPERHIEFIGDSITCGYGISGPAWESNFFSRQEDFMMTYPALIAAECKADARVIAMSGRGICHNSSGSTEGLIPQIYFRESPFAADPHDFTSWQPDVIVINAGTNDIFSGTQPVRFEQALRDFLAMIRKKNPDAPIVYAYGVMGTFFEDRIRKVIDELNAVGPAAVYVPLKPLNYEAGEFGASGHPNVRAHERCRDTVLAAVRKVTGWKY